MADEDQKQNNENTQDESQNTVKKPGFLTSKNIIILGVMIVLLGGGLTFGLMKMSKKDSPGTQKKEVKKKAELGKIFTFEPMIVNVAGTHGTRYLKVIVGLEYNAKNEKLSSEIQNYNQNPGVAPPDDAILLSGNKRMQKYLFLAEGYRRSSSVYGFLERQRRRAGPLHGASR